MFASTDAVAVGLIVLTIYLWKTSAAQAKRSKGLPFPPGPPRKPLIGNLFDMPQSGHWHKFLEWKEQYGDMVYVEALGNKMLIVNSLEAISDLFESRHTIYSNRPTFTMAGELMGLDHGIGLLQCGEEWRRQRRLTHMALSPEAVKKYDSIGDFVAKYVNSLFEDPYDFDRQLRLALGRIVMAVTYGIPVDTPDDLYITGAEKTMEMIGKATVPGAFLVDLIPALKYLPTWIPFNNIHVTASSGRAQIEEFLTRPYEHVKREWERGTNRPSFTAECLDKYQSDDPCMQASMEHTLRWAAGSMYGPGGETSYSATLNFMVALAMYPDVQAKLKEEISRVVGTERLPTLQDRDSLPYLQAAIKEALRWRPALPLSIARMTATADFYKGYYIPEGTMVLPNVWAMTKDDKSGFPAEDFVPERHLADKVKETASDPYAYAFGFGRRICPGRHLGDNIVFMLFSHIVATVGISQKKDANGNKIPLMPSYSDGLISYPRNFEIDIKPASKEVIATVMERIARFS